MMLFAKAFCSIGKRTADLLLCGLPLIILALFMALQSLLGADADEMVGLIHKFPLIMENILLSFTLLVGGAILLDLCEREAKEK